MTSLPFLYSDFHGGLNTKDSAYLLTDNQSRDLLNVQGTTAGAISKRRGLMTFATPPVLLTSVAAFGDPTSPMLIGAGGTNLYSISAAGVVTSIQTGLTAGTHWEWVQSQVVSGPQGPMYGMNGVDTPQQWAGSGSAAAWTATSGTLQNGKYMVLAGNRIWVAGVAAYPSRVFFSDLIPANNGPVTWPAANVSIFDENDGSPITGLGHVGPYIMVAKSGKLYLITDFNTGDARRLSDNVGVVSHRSIAEAPEGTYFLAETRGVYLTNGSKITPISDNIKPTLDAIPATVKATAAGIYFDGHYYLSVNTLGTIGSNDTTLDFDSALQSWWRHSFGSNQFVTQHFQPNVPILMSAKGTSAVVDQCFVNGVTTDNGQMFTWVWRGPWQSPTFYRRRRFPTPYFKKRFRQVRFDGEGSVDFSVATDFNPAETLKLSSTLGGGGANIGRARVYSIGVFNAISPVFSATSNTQDMVISYVLIITDRRDLIVA
jgi:hypothetical protein